MRRNVAVIFLWILWGSEDWRTEEKYCGVEFRGVKYCGEDFALYLFVLAPSWGADRQIVLSLISKVSESSVKSLWGSDLYSFTLSCFPGSAEWNNHFSTSSLLCLESEFSSSMNDRYSAGSSWHEPWGCGKVISLGNQDFWNWKIHSHMTKDFMNLKKRELSN